MGEDGLRSRRGLRSFWRPAEARRNDGRCAHISTSAGAALQCHLLGQVGQRGGVENFADGLGKVCLNDADGAFAGALAMLRVALVLHDAAALEAGDDVAEHDVRGRPRQAIAAAGADLGFKEIGSGQRA